MSVLQMQNVTKKFKGLTAIDGLSFAVEDQEIHALIGPNGAGKTTVFNLITNVYNVDGGSILFLGENIKKLPSNKVAAKGISRTFQNIRLFKEMSALENVMVGMHNLIEDDVFRKIFASKKCREQVAKATKDCIELMDYLKIADLAQHKAGSLPYGYQRLLEIARALASKPKLLLLDEPAAGMNTEEKGQLMHTIRNIRKDFHVAILLVEHNMDLVMNIAEQITVINYGTKIAEGTADVVQNAPQVIEAYLGRRRLTHAAN